MTAGVISLASVGCSGMSTTQRGAVIGAGAGGVLGAVIGDAAGSTTKGAIIGAVVGGAAGALIGSRMDDRAETLARELDNATVERVGEGILVTFGSGILFDFDSSQLQPEARENLSDLARVLSDDLDDYELLVAGHTDSVGAEAYNQSLSERRAQAAADFLTTRGIPAELHSRPGSGRDRAGDIQRDRGGSTGESPGRSRHLRQPGVPGGSQTRGRGLSGVSSASVLRFRATVHGDAQGNESGQDSEEEQTAP